MGFKLKIVREARTLILIFTLIAITLIVITLTAPRLN